jgi:flavin reductase (DIM6/NTAB) family NADH-FMN oxidoreductase RutF
MAVSKDEFRRALGSFASGVTVVTALSEDGQRLGLTVSAFSSLSLEPPLILICIDKRASAHDHLSEGRHFAVNILAEDQEQISARFASRDADRFNGLAIVEGKTGSPLIEGAIAHIECRVTQAYPGGDHTIFIGQVEAVAIDDENPLLYFRGRYARLA